MVFQFPPPIDVADSERQYESHEALIKTIPIHFELISFLLNFRTVVAVAHDDQPRPFDIRRIQCIIYTIRQSDRKSFWKIELIKYKQ